MITPSPSLLRFVRSALVLFALGVVLLLASIAGHTALLLSLGGISILGAVVLLALGFKSIAKQMGAGAELPDESPAPDPANSQSATAGPNDPAVPAPPVPQSPALENPIVAEQDLEMKFSKPFGGKTANLNISRKNGKYSMRGWGLSAKKMFELKDSYFPWMNTCLDEFCKKANADLYVRPSANGDKLIYNLSTTPIEGFQKASW